MLKMQLGADLFLLLMMTNGSIGTGIEVWGIIMGLSAIYNGLNGNILQLYAELSLYLLLICFLVGTLAYIMLQMHVL